MDIGQFSMYLQDIANVTYGIWSENKQAYKPKKKISKCIHK